MLADSIRQVSNAYDEGYAAGILYANSDKHNGYVSQYLLSLVGDRYDYVRGVGDAYKKEINSETRD